IHGTIVFDPIAIPADLQAGGLDGNLEITGGRIDLHGDGDPGAIASYLSFDNGMTLYFPDQISSGEANSFDGVELWLRSAGDAPIRLDMLAEVWSAPDLYGRIPGGGDEIGSPSPVPEPASMGLLAAGGLIIGTALRKPRP